MPAVVTSNSQMVQGLNVSPLVESDEPIDLLHYLRIIKRGKWGILALTVCCIIIGGFIASSTTPTYRATLKILASPQQPYPDINEQSSATESEDLFYQTQYEIISSRTIAEAVVDNLNLVDEYKLQQAKNATEKGGSGANIGAIKTQLFALFNISKQKPTDARLRLKLASNIQNDITVSVGKRSQIIDISYTSNDPQEAADVINTLAQAYIQFGLTSRLIEAQNTRSWLSDQYAQLKTQLQESEANLSAFRNRQGMFDTVQQQNVADIQIRALNGELIKAQTQLSFAEEQFFAIQDITDSNSLYSIGPVLANAVINDMVKEEARLSQRVNELSERYGKKHPQMIAVRSELSSAQVALKAEVNKVVQNIEKDYSLSKVQVKNISDLIKLNTNNIQSLQDDNFELVSLERTVENNRRVYESFQSRLMEADFKSEFAASNIQIIDRAVPPLSPFKPKIPLIIIFSGLFALFFGVVILFVHEALKNTVTTPDGIEKNLKLPVLGITPIVKKRKNHVIPEKQYLNDYRSLFAESINTIRTSLLFSNNIQPPKTILVTSATSSEGKSTLAINLAAAFSQIGKTLLLEVDLREPSIAKSLKLENGIVLSELLMGAISSSGGIQKLDVNPQLSDTTNPKLSIITCGKVATNPLRLLSSQRFDKIFAFLQNNYNYIILDAPPTLPVSDSCLLGNKVDAVIFAIKADHTKMSISKKALSRLQKLNVNVVGAVLTVAAPEKIGVYRDNNYSDQSYGIKPKVVSPASVDT